MTGAMPKYACLDQEQQNALLRGVIDRARAMSARGGRPPVVVFDLDGTLMDNRPRSAAILAELALHWKERHPELSEKVGAAKIDELVYLFSDNLQQLGVQEREIVEEAMHFWRDRFFRDAYLAHDVALTGAVAFAKATYEAGAVIVYLTGRDLPLMGLGSWASLRELGFPIGRVGTELVCKPDASIHDEAYKRDVAPQLSRLGDVIASFDNEPGNCNAFLRAYPSCVSALLDTQHFPSSPAPDAGVVCIRDFAMGRG
jgi:hypothetical protein